MSFSLRKQVALVTGATDGLGKKIAIALAQAGADVIVHGRNVQKVTQTCQEVQKLAPEVSVTELVCDLTQPAAIETQFATIKKLDILVNNAGVWLEGNTIDGNPEKILEVLGVNLTAPVLITRLLLPVLKHAEFSQIVNVSSIAGVEIPSGFFHTVYSASKFGIQAFSEALAKEFDNTNVRVMGYYPGGMETQLFVKAGHTYKQHEPWMFDPQESVDAIMFMLTRSPKVVVKRMDLINHQQG